MGEQAADRNYFPLLDGIRALAALFVVTNHSSAWLGFHFPKGYLAVDLFYALSGLVIARAYEARLGAGMAFGTFARIRIVRLFPLYLLGLLIAGLAVLARPSVELPAIRLPQAFALAMIMLPIVEPDIHNAFPLIPPSWSLFFEFVANFAYAAVAGRLQTWMILVVMLLSAIALLAAAHVAPNHDFNIGWTRRTLVAGLPRVGYSFGAGLLLHRLPARRARLDLLRRNPLPTALAAIGLVAAALGLDPPGSLSIMWDAIAVFLLFPLVVLLGMQVGVEGRGRRILAYLGMASYTIYILHKPLFDALEGLAWRSGMPNALSSRHPESGLVFMMALLALAYPLDRFYDQPIRRALGRPLRHRPEVTGSVAAGGHL
jgi:peptidoglycan/LPS O-acetylase OafA/YrhL